MKLKYVKASYNALVSIFTFGFIMWVSGHAVAMWPKMATYLTLQAPIPDIHNSMDFMAFCINMFLFSGLFAAVVYGIFYAGVKVADHAWKCILSTYKLIKGKKEEN